MDEKTKEFALALAIYIGSCNECGYTKRNVFNDIMAVLKDNNLKVVDIETLIKE